MLDKRQVQYNKFGECIELCDFTSGCGEALYGFEDNVCQRTTYNCSWAFAHSAAAVLIYTNSTRVQLPNCPNNIFSNIQVTVSVGTVTVASGASRVVTVGSGPGGPETGTGGATVTQYSGFTASGVITTVIPSAYTEVSTLVQSQVTVVSNQTTTIISTVTETLTLTASITEFLTASEIRTTSIDYTVVNSQTLTIGYTTTAVSTAVTTALSVINNNITVSGSGGYITVTGSGGGQIVTEVITTGGGVGSSISSTWTYMCLTNSPSFPPPSPTWPRRKLR
jgi:hypothetical protein